MKPSFKIGKGTTEIKEERKHKPHPLWSCLATWGSSDAVPMFSIHRWENLLTIREKSGEKDGPSEKSAVFSYSLTVIGGLGGRSSNAVVSKVRGT